MVSEQFPPKRGTTLVLHYLALPLILHQTLREQGVEGRTATLSCTFIPVNLYAAWCYAKGFSVPTEEFALEGVTQMSSIAPNECLYYLPKSLENLTFGNEFNQSLEQVTLPRNLQSLTFGHGFNQSLEHVMLPSGLQSLTFGSNFDQSLERVNLQAV